MMRKSSVVVLAVTAAFLAGCASQGVATGDSTGSTPALKWAAVTGEPPISFTDKSGNPVGMDPDLANAIGKVMGRGVNVTPEAFDSSLLGLDAKRIDVLGGASITAARIAKYDMVSYSTGGYGMMAKAGGKDIPSSIDDICGLTLAINAGDVMIPMLKDKGTACVAAGKAGVTISEFPDATANSLAVQSGRADAWVGPTISLNYTAKVDTGKWKRTGPEWGVQTIGFVTTKGSGLAQQIADALNKMIADGSYKQIMDTYGLGGNMVTKAEVNPATGD